ncbi:MAG: hypothetical protein M1826_004979 [Phylliscum demangeonii]|nr:MAG: hypothetical protein M1826_004979 [Phylliscum demangeonii]
MASPPAGTIENAIRTKITAALQPSRLEIHNDSHLHAHHQAMQGVTSRETHFRLTIVSTAFAPHRAPARHRMVYRVLKEELDQAGGIHALQIQARTPDEQEARDHREQEGVGEGGGEREEEARQSS